MNSYERAQILEIVKQCDRDTQRILEIRIELANEVRLESAIMPPVDSQHLVGRF
jgi:hypothetical protein